MKKVKSPELPAYSAADSQKIESKNTPKKFTPTTHVTETSFLHVLYPPDHICKIYIFDPSDLVSFQQIFMKKVKSPELPAYSAADSQEKDRVQKHPQKSSLPQPTSQKPVFSTF